jgi:hypothetical protein
VNIKEVFKKLLVVLAAVAVLAVGWTVVDWQDQPQVKAAPKVEQQAPTASEWMRAWVKTADADVQAMSAKIGAANLLVTVWEKNGRKGQLPEQVNEELHEVLWSVDKVRSHGMPPDARSAEAWQQALDGLENATIHELEGLRDKNPVKLAQAVAETNEATGDFKTAGEMMRHVQ